MTPPDASTFNERPWLIAAGLLLACAGAFRLWLCAQYPLSPDECYYWLWSRHLDWCYYSKGPLVAWTIWLGTALAGDTEFGVRWPAVALHVATGATLFALARTLFDARIALVTLLLALCIPLFALGSVLMTIDPLSVWFWAAGAGATWWAWRTNGWFAWSLAGLMVGLGFLAKPTNAMQGICIALFLIATPRGRAQFATPQPWLGAAVAFACTAPFWIWNAQHDWITLHHLEERSGTTKHEAFLRAESASEFLQFVVMQAVVFSPLLWLGIVIATVAAIRRWRRDRDPRWALLLTMFVPLVALFALFALNDSGQPNWTVPGYVTGLILTAALWWEWCRHVPAARWFAGLALTSALAMSVILHDTRWLGLPPASDPLARVRGWDQIGAIVLREQERLGTRFVIADHYQRAAALEWHTPGFRGRRQTFIPHYPGQIQNQFDFWEGYEKRVGEDALFVTVRKGTPVQLRMAFESVEPLGDPFWIEEHGLPVERFRLYHCRNFLGTNGLSERIEAEIARKQRKRDRVRAPEAERSD